MKNPVISIIFTLFLMALIGYGCGSDQSTNVTVTGDGGTGDPGGGGTGETIVDTVYIYADGPCDPDTVFLDDCPDCPDCPDCSGSPYEGVFYITTMQAGDVTESCEYSFVSTNYQMVTIEDNMICFAGWMVTWDEAARKGQDEWNEYTEADGVFYDYTVQFTVTFTDTDHLTSSLTYHIEAGYVGYSASYICDDQFFLGAERTTLEEAAPQMGLKSRSLPTSKIRDLLPALDGK